MRLSLGEFYAPGEYAQDTWTARTIFLQLVANRAPEVLGTLNQTVWPHYRRVLAGLSDDPILISEIEGIEGLQPAEGEETQHVTLFLIGGIWTLIFHYGYNKALTDAHIQAAREFYEAATFSRDREHWNACVYNLFCSVELAAKATFLVMPGLEPRVKGHGSIKAEYSRVWSVGDYKDALEKLGQTRKAARYLTAELRVTRDELQQLMEIAQRMIDDALARVGLEPEEANGPT
jgi:HEPN domain-containing protein